MTSPSLSDPNVLIVISLSDGPKHGYAIMNDVADFAGVKLGPGTLYGAISRLEAQGLIEPLASDDRRQPYELTAAGRRVLEALREQLDTLAATAAARMGA